MEDWKLQYLVNQNGGVYWPGKAKPTEVRAQVLSTINDPQNSLGPAQIQKAAGVSKTTYYRWKGAYETEHFPAWNFCCSSFFCRCGG